MSAATQSIISVRNLGKSFRISRAFAKEMAADPRFEARDGRRLFHVLRDISFDVPAGEAVGLVGPNGSGKSTLLKILAGVMQSDEGTMEIRGRVAAMLEVGAGFHGDLTGAENVQLQASLLGFSREEIGRKLGDVIAFAEMERFMDMPVRHYSSGMVVRLGFATAIHLQPKILFLDETFAVGDARFLARAVHRLREMKAAGVTLILVSHNINELLEFSDRVIWLDKGRIRGDGPARETLLDYLRAAGADALGGTSLVRGLMGQVESMRLPEGESPIRIESVEIGGTTGEENRRIEMNDPLELCISLSAKDAPPTMEELQLDLWFKRDDGKDIARARTFLTPSDCEQTPQGELLFKWPLKRIQLTKGIYTLNVTISKPSEIHEGNILDKFELPTKLEITTEIETASRMAVAIPAHWE